MLTVIAAILVSSFIGIILGTMTGLLPGVHVNNVALFMLSFSPSLIPLITGTGTLAGNGTGMDDATAALAIATMIITTSVTHSFVDFIPSTFFGAPDDETALSVLPAHRLLLRGEGHFAVLLSAAGSYCAVAICLLLLIPFRMLIGDPFNGYGFLSSHMVVVLAVLVCMMMLSESPRKSGRWKRLRSVGAALFVFCISGVLGLIILPMGSRSPFGFYSSPLFPALSGLFGLSTLYLSLTTEPVIPAQRIETAGSFRRKLSQIPRPLQSIVAGTFAGSVVGFLPGVSAAHAAVIAGLRSRIPVVGIFRIFRSSPAEVTKSSEIVNSPDDADFAVDEYVDSDVDEKDDSERSVILTLSAINTANSFFCLAALFIILRARNGAVLAVQRLIPVTEWNSQNTPVEFPLLLSGVIVTATIALFLTDRLGAFFARRIGRINYTRIIQGIMVFIVIMVAVFNGPIGILTLFVATSIGMLAPWLSVRRSHAMGFLLLPVLLSLSGIT